MRSKGEKLRIQKPTFFYAKLLFFPSHTKTNCFPFEACIPCLVSLLRKTGDRSSLLFLLEKVLLKQMIVVFIIHEKFLLIFAFFTIYNIVLG
jgi:hypothetical protein